MCWLPRSRRAEARPQKRPVPAPYPRVSPEAAGAGPNTPWNSFSLRSQPVSLAPWPCRVMLFTVKYDLSGIRSPRRGGQALCVLFCDFSSDPGNSRAKDRVTPPGCFPAGPGLAAGSGSGVLPERTLCPSRSPGVQAEPLPLAVSPDVWPSIALQGLQNSPFEKGGQGRLVPECRVEGTCLSEQARRDWGRGQLTCLLLPALSCLPRHPPSLHKP